MTKTYDDAQSLAAALTREHHEIDGAIEDYLDSVQSAPHERAQPLLRALEALRRHIYLEEEIVFPRLPHGPLMMPLMVMRREHGELWRHMDVLAERLCSPGTDTNDLDESCRELLSLLERHNAKEEPVIYPHLDTDLGADERTKVHAILANGTLPPGWVCQDA